MNPLTDADGEVRELGDLDFARAGRLTDLPGGLQAKLRRGRGPQKAPTKELISLTRLARRPDPLPHDRRRLADADGRGVAECGAAVGVVGGIAAPSV